MNTAQTVLGTISSRIPNLSNGSDFQVLATKRLVEPSSDLPFFKASESKSPVNASSMLEQLTCGTNQLCKKAQKIGTCWA